MALFGIVFNINPIAINKVIMGNLGEEVVNPAAALRVIIGGSAIAIGITALYCRNLPAEQASTLPVVLGIGFIVLIAAIVSTKLRGFSDHIPIPPAVSFIILTVIAFYASSNAN